MLVNRFNIISSLHILVCDCGVCDWPGRFWPSAATSHFLCGLLWSPAAVSSQDQMSFWKPFQALTPNQMQRMASNCGVLS